MSTQSFERSFVVKGTDSSHRLLSDLASPRVVNVIEMDHKKETEKGIELLQQRFSDSSRR